MQKAGKVEKVGICLPTNRGLKAKTLASLLKLIAHSQLHPQFAFVIVIGTEGFNTAENRTWIAAKALKQGCSHTFWVDDDMVYEEDTLTTLLQYDKAIVGARYANRRGTGEVIEYLTDGLTDGGTGLFKCSALGGGCILIKAEVFLKVPQPWFWYTINSLGAVTMSHDWYFCKKARERGYDIWCDGSLQPKHIGEHEY